MDPKYLKIIYSIINIWFCIIFKSFVSSASSMYKPLFINNRHVTLIENKYICEMTR